MKNLRVGSIRILAIGCTDWQFVSIAKDNIYVQHGSNAFVYVGCTQTERGHYVCAT